MLIADKEIWKDIKGYEGLYQISNLGRVKSLNYNRTNKEKIMKVFKNKYYGLILRKNNKNKYFRLHRLLALNFLKKEKYQNIVMHIDGNCLNNNLNNLKWGTQSENVLQAYRKDRTKKAKCGEKSNFSKLNKKQVLFIKKNKKKYSQYKLAEIFNVSQPCINFIINNKRWQNEI